MTALQLYGEYSKVRFFLAGHDDFDFDADYAVYEAMANNKPKTIERITRRRLKNGWTVKQVKFSKVKASAKDPAKVKGSHAFCKARYERAYSRYLSERYGTPEKRQEALKGAPMHLKSVSGKQGEKGKEGTLVANYVVERPKRVESAFGDVDYSEVF